jgi:hypothetical protein
MSRARQLLRYIYTQPSLRWTATVAALVYLLLYLAVIGDLNLHPGRTGIDFYAVGAPWSRMFAPRAPFHFEALAVLELGPATYLLAPVNLAIGFALALLVGLNAALGLLAWRQPKACYRGTTSGVLAAIPGLLAGGACCGPALFLLLGLQASAGVIALFGVLVPIAALLLLASAVLMIRQIDPDLLQPG